jgi:terminase small subunit-like protein
MTERDQRFGGGSAHAGPPAVEEVEARAARLGITPERVLAEYRRIAFASLRDIAEWGPGEDGLRVKLSKDLTPAQVAAIAEIVASASTGKIYRIKMHDKKPVLDAIARYLGMFPPAQAAPIENNSTHTDAENARERLISEFDRLAAQEATRPGDQEPDR